MTFCYRRRSRRIKAQDDGFYEAASGAGPAPATGEEGTAAGDSGGSAAFYLANSRFLCGWSRSPSPGGRWLPTASTRLRARLLLVGGEDEVGVVELFGGAGGVEGLVLVGGVLLVGVDAGGADDAEEGDAEGGEEVDAEAAAGFAVGAAVGEFGVDEDFGGGEAEEAVADEVVEAEAGDGLGGFLGLEGVEGEEDGGDEDVGHGPFADGVDEFADLEVEFAGAATGHEEGERGLGERGDDAEEEEEAADDVVALGEEFPDDGGDAADFVLEDETEGAGFEGDGGGGPDDHGGSEDADDEAEDGDAGEGEEDGAGGEAAVEGDDGEDVERAPAEEAPGPPGGEVGLVADGLEEVADAGGEFVGGFFVRGKVELVLDG